MATSRSSGPNPSDLATAAASRSAVRSASVRASAVIARNPAPGRADEESAAAVDWVATTVRVPRVRAAATAAARAFLRDITFLPPSWG